MLAFGPSDTRGNRTSNLLTLHDKAYYLLVV